jgi:hypothetical protein
VPIGLTIEHNVRPVNASNLLDEAPLVSEIYHSVP